MTAPPTSVAIDRLRSERPDVIILSRPVDVAFEKPLFLPAKVEFATDEQHFAVRSDDIVHLRGELS